MSNRLSERERLQRRSYLHTEGCYLHTEAGGRERGKAGQEHSECLAEEVGLTLNPWGNSTGQLLGLLSSRLFPGKGKNDLENGNLGILINKESLKLRTEK